MKKLIGMLCIIVIAMTLLIGCDSDNETHTHNFEEWQVVKNATCTENGERERVCSCGEKQTQAIPATGHTFGEWNTVKNPTCTETGEEESLCSCGEKQIKTIPATGHTFGEWNTVKSPTCTETGEEESLCSCGEKQTQAIPATGHLWKEATTEMPKTCANCGITEGSPLEPELPKVYFSSSYYTIYPLIKQDGGTLIDGDARGVLDDLEAKVFKSGDTYKIEIQMKGEVKKMKHSYGSFLNYYVYVYDIDGNSLIEKEMRVTDWYKSVGESISVYNTIFDLPYSPEYKIYIFSF